MTHLVNELKLIKWKPKITAFSSFTAFTASESVKRKRKRKKKKQIVVKKMENIKLTVGD